MKTQRRIKTLSVIFVLSISSYGCSDNLANKTAEQAKILQQSISTIAKACTGKLSVSMELTGDIKKPAITTVSCSEMDKKNEYFQELTDKDLEVIKRNFNKLN